MATDEGRGEDGGGDNQRHDETENGAEGPSGQQPVVETHTRATTQGFIRTTVTQAAPDAEQDESVLAVGVGAQVLPGKGETYGGASAPELLDHDTENMQARAAEEAREAVGDVVRAQMRAEDGLITGVDSAMRAREAVVDAGMRGEVRARVERRRKGWRSPAFDL